MEKMNGVRMQTFTNYVLSGHTTYIHIYVPLSFDYENTALRGQIYRSWHETRHLPQEYTDVNIFIEEVNKITSIDQVMLGKSPSFGNYVCFIIIKNTKTTATITQLEKLINN